MPRRPRELGTPQSPADYFGAELRAYREAAGLSRPQFADQLGYTAQWIGQIEQRKSTPSEEFAKDCDTFFTTNGTFHRLWEWIKLVGQFQILPPGFRPFAEAEVEATYIKIFAPLLIPGLFQTGDYARAVLKVGQRPEKFEELFAARMRRQEILAGEDPPWMLVLLCEIAVRRVVGSGQVMKAQLQRLLDLAGEPHITIQLVPTDAPVYQASGFVILSFDERSDICYMDSAGSYGPLLESTDDVDERVVVFDQVVRSAALTAEDSEQLIRAVMEGM
ncbi:helix-turn-helix domain-containing protein [Actinomadura sp. HBU206391]|uniref:helix-turn-helix domain-containing protein n=1 Tax=Actinomadura sp. HBU206391 TaxID=2731692 RepID=UPI00164F73E1|nr:helix-turn-helix transcriptional regulator [Actinomadura sp. HBU206391]MBC6462949.1 helix-turn-helix domain-containing protein [Actinomadura sp. HBU206391]